MFEIDREEYSDAASFHFHLFQNVYRLSYKITRIHYKAGPKSSQSRFRGKIAADTGVSKNYTSFERLKIRKEG